MIHVAAASELITAHFYQLKSRLKNLSHLHAQIIATHVVAERDQPSFHRVAMDGIAIKFDRERRQFPIEGIQRAGEKALVLQNFENAIEVMTGAPLPEGADSVVPYEVISIEGDVAELLPEIQIQKGQNIHRKGSDYRQGDRVIEAGQQLTSPLVALVASQGLTQILCKDFGRIAIVSTGDELVPPGESIEDYQVRRSNPYALASELQALGIGREDISLFHLHDDRDEIFEGLRKIIDEFDLIIVSGGVSRGKYDFVHMVMGDLGVKNIFHKLHQRPGKPLLFGVGGKGQCIFGLPGNPVSAMICLRRYIVEGLKGAGRAKSIKAMYAKINFDLEFNKDLTYFLPVRIIYDRCGQVWASKIESNGSGDFYSLAQSDGFIEFPHDQSLFKKGEAFPLYLWESAWRP